MQSCTAEMSFARLQQVSSFVKSYSAGAPDVEVCIKATVADNASFQPYSASMQFLASVGLRPPLTDLANLVHLCSRQAAPLSRGLGQAVGSNRPPLAHRRRFCRPG